MRTKSLMLVSEGGDTAYYRIACGCKYTSDHDAHLMFSDDGDGSLRMEFTTTVYYCEGYIDSFWRKFTRRFSHCCQVMFSGWFELDGDFMLNADNLDAFEEAIQESRKRLSAYNSRDVTKKVSLKELVGSE